MKHQLRKANISDANGIRKLVNAYAAENKMLARSLSEIYENIRDYHVVTYGDQVIGSCALHVFWEDLAELRSLAVHPEHRGRGLGQTLIEHVMSEAPALGVKRIFILTAIPGYFRRAGFRTVDRSVLPHKIWAECIRCPKFPDCDEIAMITELG